jgi:hypothetical protein
MANFAARKWPEYRIAKYEASVGPAPFGPTNLKKLYTVIYWTNQYFSFIVWVGFIDGGSRRKPTDRLQLTDKLYHIMLHDVVVVC